MSERNMYENINDGENNASGKKKKKGSIIAFIICVLIALAIWTYAKNVEDKNESIQGSDPTAEQQAESPSDGAGE